VMRYLSESGHTLPHNPDWSLARQAVWYWTRILVEIAPARVLWWDNPAAMDRPPQRWQAPAGTIFPRSDPAPPGNTSNGPKWAERSWQELADQALRRHATGHLSVLDHEGFPLPVRARAIATTQTGFALDMPSGIPWTMTGRACLTFGGVESFIGEVRRENAILAMRVDRALPVFPMTQDTKQLWQPTEDTRAQLMRRLREETMRRGQAIPAIPLERPKPTDGHLRRMQRALSPSLPVR
jgi:hypothetical protein